MVSTILVCQGLRDAHGCRLSHEKTTLRSKRELSRENPVCSLHGERERSFVEAVQSLLPLCRLFTEKGYEKVSHVYEDDRRDGENIISFLAITPGNHVSCFLFQLLSSLFTPIL